MKILTSALAGLIVGTLGLFLLFSYTDLFDGVAIESPGETVSFETYDSCGASLLTVASEDWFPDFLSAAEELEIDLSMIPTACHIQEEGLFAFVYLGSDHDYPGYFEDSGIYRFNINNAKALDLERANYAPSSTDPNSNYWLPTNFDHKNGASLYYEAGPVAFGCEEGPCCMPVNTYQYDAIANAVVYVSGKCIGGEE